MSYRAFGRKAGHVFQILGCLDELKSRNTIIECAVRASRLLLPFGRLWIQELPDLRIFGRTLHAHRIICFKNVFEFCLIVSVADLLQTILNTRKSDFHLDNGIFRGASVPNICQFAFAAIEPFYCFEHIRLSVIIPANHYVEGRWLKCCRLNRPEVFDFNFCDSHNAFVTRRANES